MCACVCIDDILTRATFSCYVTISGRFNFHDLTLSPMNARRSRSELARMVVKAIECICPEFAAISSATKVSPPAKNQWLEENHTQKPFFQYLKNIYIAWPLRPFWRLYNFFQCEWVRDSHEVNDSSDDDGGFCVFRFFAWSKCVWVSSARYRTYVRWWQRRKQWERICVCQIWWAQSPKPFTPTHTHTHRHKYMIDGILLFVIIKVC